MKILKNLIPHALVVLIFYLITIVYFKAEFFDGKTIAQDDIVRYEGMAKQTADYNKTHDSPTLWTSSMFAGMPVYLFQAQFPDQPLTFLDKFFKGFISHKTAHLLFMTMFCFYLAMLCFGVNSIISTVGAVAFGLSTYNLVLIDVGHVTKLWAIAYSPLILAGTYLVFQGKKALGFAVFALAMTLQLRANHYQITYYLAFVGVFYALSELYFAFQNKKLKDFAQSSAILVVAILLAVGTNAGRMMTTLEYAKYSIRGKAELTPINLEEKIKRGEGDGLDKDYAFSWSQGKMETLTLLIPNLYGGSSSEKLDKNSATLEILKGAVSPEQVQQLAERNPFMYWGDQPFTSAPIYAGAIICFLCVLGLLIFDPKLRFWLLAGIILTMMFAWGKNFETFNFLMFDYFPAFNKFRSVSMALSLTVLLMSMAAVLALQQISVMEWNKEFSQKVMIAFGLTGGLALLLAFAGGIFLNFQGANDAQFEQIIQAVISDRKSMLRSDAIRSAVLIALTISVLYFFLNKKISATIAFAVISVLALFDGWQIGKRYLNESDFEANAKEKFHAPTPADQFILKDKDPNYRVFNLNNPFNDAQTSYYHKSVGGYFPAKARRYQDLIERQLEKEKDLLIKDLQTSKMPKWENYRVLNMLNTRYVKISEDANGVLKNDSLALGSAWFVKNLIAVQNPDAEMQALDSLKTATDAVFDATKFPIKAKTYNTENAKISLLEYAPNALTYESNSSAEGFVVFSESYYAQGWKVSIDDKPATQIRANYVLRGLEVPAGKHVIKFVFEPESYQIGSTITQISAILVSLSLVLAVGLIFYKKEEKVL
ncbi:MAG: hypothetical protein EAZ97_11335 [Bacteroidetes bacterium]|nr:MAG: hypothetical protein EAZ97_11335 [Bacteroidota bacterium]